MISVEITKKSIVSNGHASELICNSVSVLMWALSMSLLNESAEDLVVKESEGHEEISFKPSKTTIPIFNGIVSCFKAMGEQFPNEIKIFIKK
jgi:uncharacterized protein YsxB (DUF464 family)